MATWGDDQCSDQRHGDTDTCRPHGPFRGRVSKRGDKRASSPPRRAAERLPHLAAEGVQAEDREARRDAVRRRVDSGLGRIAGYGAAGGEGAEETWRPWMRRPSWEYLPHLNAPIGGGEVEEGESTFDRHAHEGVPDQRRPSGQNQLEEHNALEGSSGTEIRGRGTSPGPLAASSRGSDAGGRGGSQIRGHAVVPGAKIGIDVGRQRAQQRLDARNATIATSLADHAERVAKRAAEHRKVETETPAARIAALRRRVAQRCSQSTVAKEVVQDCGNTGAGLFGKRSSDEGEGAGDGRWRGAATGKSQRDADVEDAHDPMTNEVTKIHCRAPQLRADQSGGSQPPRRGGDDGGGGATGSGGGEPPGADSGGWRCSASTAAASQVAWHSVSAGRGASGSS